MRPLIGVFTSERHAGALATLQRCDESAPERELRLGTPYLRAVEAAGGLPVVLAPDDPGDRRRAARPARRARARGRPRPRPARLRRRRAARAARPDRCGHRRRRARARPRGRRARDAAARASAAAPRPSTSIRGGTLHQHVDDHRQVAPASEEFHTVAVARGSRLAALTGGGTLPVNSFHHQAAGELGAGLRAVAVAPDGTVEAIEDPTRPFLLGVQWHAEAMVGPARAARAVRGLWWAMARTPRLALAA